VSKQLAQGIVAQPRIRTRVPALTTRPLSHTVYTAIQQNNKLSSAAVVLVVLYFVAHWRVPSVCGVLLLEM